MLQSRCRIVVGGRGRKRHHQLNTRNTRLVAEDIFRIIFFWQGFVAIRISTVGVYIGRYISADRLYYWFSPGSSSWAVSHFLMDEKIIKLKTRIPLFQQ